MPHETSSLQTDLSDFSDQADDASSALAAEGLLVKAADHKPVRPCPLAVAKIDSLGFARDGRLLEGLVPVVRLLRLADQLFSALDSSLSIRLQGLQEDCKSFLRLQVTGELVMNCQRCLVGVAVPLQVDSLLQLIAAGEVWPDEELLDDQVDAIEASEVLDVMELIESELLLALPLALRHEHCELPLAAINNHGSAAFAALAALKKH